MVRSDGQSPRPAQPPPPTPPQRQPPTQSLTCRHLPTLGDSFSQVSPTSSSLSFHFSNQWKMGTEEANDASDRLYNNLHRGGKVGSWRTLRRVRRVQGTLRRVVGPYVGPYAAALLSFVSYDLYSFFIVKKISRTIS